MLVLFNYLFVSVFSAEKQLFQLSFDVFDVLFRHSRYKEWDSLIDLIALSIRSFEHAVLRTDPSEISDLFGARCQTGVEEQRIDVGQIRRGDGV